MVVVTQVNRTFLRLSADGTYAECGELVQQPHLRLAADVGDVLVRQVSLQAGRGEGAEAVFHVPVEPDHPRYLARRRCALPGGPGANPGRSSWRIRRPDPRLSSTKASLPRPLPRLHHCCRAAPGHATAGRRAPAARLGSAQPGA